jgi:hypothetical protein
MTGQRGTRLMPVDSLGVCLRGPGRAHGYRQATSRKAAPGPQAGLSGGNRRTRHGQHPCQADPVTELCSQNTAVDTLAWPGRDWQGSSALLGVGEAPERWRKDTVTPQVAARRFGTPSRGCGHAAVAGRQGRQFRWRRALTGREQRLPNLHETRKGPLLKLVIEEVTGQPCYDVVQQASLDRHELTPGVPVRSSRPPALAIRAAPFPTIPRRRTRRMCSRSCWTIWTSIGSQSPGGSAVAPGITDRLGPDSATPGALRARSAGRISPVYLAGCSSHSSCPPPPARAGRRPAPGPPRR